MTWFKKLFCFHQWQEINTMDWINKYDWPATQTISFYLLQKGSHRPYECVKCGKLTVEHINKVMTKPYI